MGVGAVAGVAAMTVEGVADPANRVIQAGAGLLNTAVQGVGDAGVTAAGSVGQMKDALGVGGGMGGGGVGGMFQQNY